MEKADHQNAPLRFGSEGAVRLPTWTARDLRERGPAEDAKILEVRLHRPLQQILSHYTVFLESVRWFASGCATVPIFFPKS